MSKACQYELAFTSALRIRNVLLLHREIINDFFRKYTTQ